MFLTQYNWVLNIVDSVLIKLLTEFTLNSIDKALRFVNYTKNDNFYQ